MTKPALTQAPLSLSDALAACNAAERAMHAATSDAANALPARDKTAQKRRLATLKAAQVAYQMALLNLHRTHQRVERQEMTK